MRRIIHHTLVVVAVGSLVTGCATTAQDTELANVRALAEQAAADAKAARQAAAAAQSRADAAQSRADAAMSAANDAKSQSAETEAKIDRMFKKAMYK